jgi:hypothetical protein
MDRLSPVPVESSMGEPISPAVIQEGAIACQKESCYSDARGRDPVQASWPPIVLHPL